MTTYDDGYRDGLAAGRADAQKYLLDVGYSTCADCLEVNPGWAVRVGRAGGYCPYHSKERERQRNRNSHRKARGQKPEIRRPTPIPEPAHAAPVVPRVLNSNAAADLSHVRYYWRSAHSRLRWYAERGEDPPETERALLDADLLFLAEVALDITDRIVSGAAPYGYTHGPDDYPALLAPIPESRDHDRPLREQIRRAGPPVSD